MNVKIEKKDKILRSARKSGLTFSDMSFDENIVLLSNNEPYYVTQSNIQKAISFTSKDEIFERFLKPSIVLESIENEISYGGSGDITLKLSCNLLSSLKKYSAQNYDRDIFKKIESNIISSIRSVGRSTYRKDFYKFLNQEISNQRIREILKYAISYTGIRFPIVCEKILKKETYIDVQDGYGFKIFPNESFLQKPWDKKDVAIVVVDGAIIEVSEIHHMLEFCNSNKIPGIIFCREMSPDVLNTLYVNKGRGTLDVIPFEIPIVEDNLNILKDISIVAGADIISIEKGDVLSASIRRGFAQVDSVVIDKSGINIKNKNTSKDIESHVSFLKNKKNSLDVEVHKYYDSRIKSLTGKKIKINIGLEDTEGDAIAIEKIDSFLRSLSCLVSTGSVDMDLFYRDFMSRDFSNLIEKEISKKIVESLKSTGKKVISSGALFNATKKSLSLASSILSTEILLLEDRK